MKPIEMKKNDNSGVRTRKVPIRKAPTTAPLTPQNFVICCPVCQNIENERKTRTLHIIDLLISLARDIFVFLYFFASSRYHVHSKRPFLVQHPLPQLSLNIPLFSITTSFLSGLSQCRIILVSLTRGTISRQFLFLILFQEFLFLIHDKERQREKDQCKKGQ